MEQNVHLTYYGLIKILELIYSYNTNRDFPLQYWLDHGINLFVHKSRNNKSGEYFINTKGNRYLVKFPTKSQQSDKENYLINKSFSF